LSLPYVRSFSWNFGCWWDGASMISIEYMRTLTYRMVWLNLKVIQPFSYQIQLRAWKLIFYKTQAFFKSLNRVIDHWSWDSLRWTNKFTACTIVLSKTHPLFKPTHGVIGRQSWDSLRLTNQIHDLRNNFMQNTSHLQINSWCNRPLKWSSIKVGNPFSGQIHFTGCYFVVKNRSIGVLYCIEPVFYAFRFLDHAWIALWLTSSHDSKYSGRYSTVACMFLTQGFSVKKAMGIGNIDRVETQCVLSLKKTPLFKIALLGTNFGSCEVCIKISL
jgi:hypothetical protein